MVGLPSAGWSTSIRMTTSELRYALISKDKDAPKTHCPFLTWYHESDSAVTPSETAEAFNVATMPNLLMTLSLTLIMLSSVSVPHLTLTAEIMNTTVIAHTFDSLGKTIVDQIMKGINKKDSQVEKLSFEPLLVERKSIKSFK